jgi:cytoskeletal protein CcmA (bactofilin family)
LLYYNVDMKKLLVVSVLVALIFPVLTHGAEIKFGKEPFFLNKGETLNQNLYFGGQGANIAGDVNGDVVAAGSVIGVKGNVSGDVIAAGGRVNVSGNVGGNVFAAGGTVDVEGNVAKSVRVAGGTITISGTINGDLVIAGGQVYVLPDAVIKGDLLLGGGRADIEGSVVGKIWSQARELTLNNQVGGTTDLNVEDLVLGPKAVLAQGLTYHSYTEAKIDPAAKITGAVNFDRKQDSGRNRMFLPAIFSAAIFFKFLMLLAAALVILYVFKKFTASVVRDSMSGWKNIWFGFTFLVLTPIIGILLMITVIGIPLGILVFLGYVFVLVVSSVLAVVSAGAWLQKWIWKKEILDWKTALLGAATFLILGWIPLVGWLASCLIFLSVLGSFHAHLHRELWSKR